MMSRAALAVSTAMITTALLSPVTVRSADWEISTIDSSGAYPSLAFAPATDTPSVAYYPGRYAEFDGSTWNVTFTYDAADLVSLSFNPNLSYPAIVFNGGSHTGNFVFFDGSAWSSTETFDPVQEHAQYPSLAFDPLTGEATVSHFNSHPPEGELWLSIRGGTGWTSDIVDDESERTGGYTSLRYQPGTGRRAIAYQDVTNLDTRYAEYDGTGWVRVTVDSVGDVGTGISLAFNPLPPHAPGISYVEVGGDLRYASRLADEWVVQTVDATSSVGGGTSLAFNPKTGISAIAYQDQFDGTLRYAELNDGLWGSEIVDDSGYTGHYPSLAFDPITGVPWITYGNQTTGELLLARRILPNAPGLERVVSNNDHIGASGLGIEVDLAASVGVDSGAVTTETRLAGVTTLELTFFDVLKESVCTLDNGAIVATPDPGSEVITNCNTDRTVLTVDFYPPLPDADTYHIVLTDSVVADGLATPGDRDLEIRSLVGNVVNESGPGPQVVNALDIGLSGIRGKFGAPVGDPGNAQFDVNQDGAINVGDVSCVRLTCGVFGNTAP